MSSKQYSTSHQGLAAFFVLQGGEVVEVAKKQVVIKGNEVERPFFTFNISVEAGKKLADSFFNKESNVEPCDYYNNIAILRSKAYDLSKALDTTPVTE